MAETISLPTPRRARGRPKGTGIDDTEVLNRVCGLLRADPNLKSTTAIKRLGIGDPSVIRRLRNKLKSDPALVERVDTPTSLTANTHTPLGANSKTMHQLIAGPHVPDTNQKSSVGVAPTAPPETDQQKRTRNALLLAAYLEALAKSAPQTADSNAQPARSPPLTPNATTEPTSSGHQLSIQPPAPTAPPPPEPASVASTPPKGFNFPGMPAFLQPFSQSPASPPMSAAPTNQLEGMKLAVEAMTSMTKLQLHITENAMAYSPMALMLQGQAFIGQMLLASLTGQLDATKKKPADGK